MMNNRLLLANPDIEWRELNHRFLVALGYEVETSTDGLDCLAKLRRSAPAMLVLDLDLLWGGGNGVLAWLREESTAPRIPVLLMGLADAGPNRERFNESPVVEYLPKPVGPFRLLESIRSAFVRAERSEPLNLNFAPRSQTLSWDVKGYRL